VYVNDDDGDDDDNDDDGDDETHPWTLLNRISTVA
jgi:hypothetical protein